MRIRNIEDAHLAVAEAIDKKRVVIRAQADIDRQHAAFRPDLGHLFRLPFAIPILVTEPEFRGERCRGKRVIVLLTPGPANLKRRAWHLEDLLWLACMEVPQDHRIADLLQRLRILYQAAKFAGVVVPTREGSCEQDVFPGEN